MSKLILNVHCIITIIAKIFTIPNSAPLSRRIKSASKKLKKGKPKPKVANALVA